MTTWNPDEEPALARKPRRRWVPPRPNTVRPWLDPDAAQAQSWASGLRRGRRRWLWVLGGNGLLLFSLVGLPFLRGRQRARDSERSYGALTACLYGGAGVSGGGTAALDGEAEHFAAQLLRADRGWLAGCIQRLDALAPSPALFVLPSVKSAEAGVREAVELVRQTLQGAGAYQVGEAMPREPLRAMAVLREALDAQLSAADFARDSRLPARLEPDAALPLPARIPLYAAGDAALSLWGDDHRLQAVGLDGTGLSYIEVAPGRPFVRARLVRPALLRAFLARGPRPWLLWTTPEARCAERALGCYAKTTEVAVAPLPLLAWPAARPLAGHLAGRADRSWADLGERVLMATATAERRVVIRAFTLPEDAASSEDLPPLAASAQWQPAVDQALLLPASSSAVVLGAIEESDRGALVQLTPTSTQPLAALPRAQRLWMTGCGREDGAGFAFGNGQSMIVGRLQRKGEAWVSRTWPAVPFASESEIHPTRPSSDRVLRVCSPHAALVLARDRAGQLSAIACRGQATECQALPVARGVAEFAVVPTARGVLVAYAGDEKPQIRTRQLDLPALSLGAEGVPGACWSSRTGLCRRPLLVRLGRRIVLAAPEGTDLVAVESADEGQTWEPVPVL